MNDDTEPEQVTAPNGDMARIAGGFAHDFNNLLTVITGNLQIVEARVPDDFLRSLLREAALACEMGARMTERLLTYARDRRLSPITMDLNSVVGAMREVLKRAMGEAIKIDMELDSTMPLVVLDQAEVESAILNIAINARDAMPDGGVFTKIESAPGQGTLVALYIPAA